MPCASPAGMTCKYWFWFFWNQIMSDYFPQEPLTGRTSILTSFLEEEKFTGGNGEYIQHIHIYIYIFAVFTVIIPCIWIDPIQYFCFLFSIFHWKSIEIQNLKLLVESWFWLLLFFFNWKGIENMFKAFGRIYFFGCFFLFNFSLQKNWKINLSSFW